MTDMLQCSRCNRGLGVVLAAIASTIAKNSGEIDVVRCPDYGSLAVVEGGDEIWYYPRAWCVALAHEPAVLGALVGDAIAAYRVAHQETQP